MRDTAEVTYLKNLTTARKAFLKILTSSILASLKNMNAFLQEEFQWFKLMAYYFIQELIR